MGADRTAIICDIDGTLADIRHRLHYVHGKPKSWDKFFAEMGKDTVHVDIAWMVRKLNEHASVILVSGRPENYRNTTVAWLIANNIYHDALYMRPEGDMRADYIVKSQILDGILDDGWNIRLVIDDRPSVVAMWRESGLTCVQCDPSPESITTPGLLTIMVGPSGAGKSTWLMSDDAKTLGIHPSHIVSSDQIRADLCGDFRDQTRNADVFDALHRITKARISAGVPTVVDATNLKRKDRLAVVNCAPLDAAVRYIVIDRTLSDKHLDAGWRSEVPGFIDRHAQTFASQLKDILRGDALPNVTVIDRRWVAA